MRLEWGVWACGVLIYDLLCYRIRHVRVGVGVLLDQFFVFFLTPIRRLLVNP